MTFSELNELINKVDSVELFPHKGADSSRNGVHMTLSTGRERVTIFVGQDIKTKESIIEVM